MGIKQLASEHVDQVGIAIPVGQKLAKQAMPLSTSIQQRHAMRVQQPQTCERYRLN